MINDKVTSSGKNIHPTSVHASTMKMLTVRELRRAARGVRGGDGRAPELRRTRGGDVSIFTP